MDSPGGRRLKVLVVDDEPIVCRTVPRALRRLDLDVRACQTAVAALEEVSSTVYDIVITDVVLGDIDGIQILEEVQKRSRRTKVIIITAFATRDLAREAMSRGAFDFIAKPFEAKEIREKTARAVEAVRSESSTE